MNEILFERGTKRTCQSCASRFYDLARLPIVCPKCGADYIEIVRPVTPPYQRRGRGVFGQNHPSPPIEAAEAEAPEAEETETEGEEPELDGEAELEETEETTEE